MSISAGEQAIIDAITELKEAFEEAQSERRDAEEEARRGREEDRASRDGDERQSVSGINEFSNPAGIRASEALGEKLVKGFDVQKDTLVAGFSNLTTSLDGLTKNFRKSFSRFGDSFSKQVSKSFSMEKFKDFQSSPAGMAAGLAGGGMMQAGAFAGQQMGELKETYFKEIRELTLTLYDTERELQRTLGISRQTAKVNREAFKEVRNFLGAKGLEQANKAFNSLFNTFTDFTFATVNQQQKLVEVGATLDHLGYSTENFAEGVLLLTKALNMTEEAAAQTQLSLTAMAMDIGVSPEKMAQDFIGAGNAVAKLGSQGEVAFRRLAIAAKVTGIEVGRLIQMTEKFDTFDGAAEQAGKLNAALGGNFVNAMDLMTATDPVERFNMIRNAIKDAGLSFDTMSYYQKNFYKDSLGLENVGELANMLSGNMDSLNSQLGKTSDEYSEMAKRGARVQKIQDFINTIFHTFLEVLDPLIDSLGDFTDRLAEGLKSASEGMTKYKKVFIAITLGMSAFVFVGSQVIAVVGATVAILAAFIPGLQGVSAAIAAISASLSAVGVAVGGVGAGAGGLAVAFTASGGAAEILKDVMVVLGDFLEKVYNEFDKVIMQSGFMTHLFRQFSCLLKD